MVSKPLSEKLIILKSKTDHIHMIKSLNLWGHNLTDISIIAQCPMLDTLALSVNKNIIIISNWDVIKLKRATFKIKII